MDVADRELERMIERRPTNAESDADEREELWKESVRRYEARRQEEARAARVEYHRGQAARLRAVLEGLVEHHEAEAEKLTEAQQKGAV